MLNFKIMCATLNHIRVAWIEKFSYNLVSLDVQFDPPL
jgi:hypothetical protein